MSYDDDVGKFHEKFGLPVAGESPPAIMEQHVFEFRMRFMHEELEEFASCHRDGDLEGALDALVDLAWVAIGTAHYMHAPFDAAWREVVRANMEKVRAETDPNKPYRDGVGGAVVKPNNWRPPDIAGVLRRHSFAGDRRIEAINEMVELNQKHGFYDVGLPAVPESEGGEP